ncbi:MAG: heavy-metal-associated domain-containing protein [Deltaproteobacteria bacterium]|nr:heavy-metal-associated domain-containing protein [Deltaproteobacteria bacterium]
MISTRDILTVITATAVLIGIVAVAAPALAAVDHYEVQVDGLACPFCAYGLEKKLKELPGVANVQIELNTGWASFDVSSGVLLPAPVQAAVRDAGFTPRDIKVTASGPRRGCDGADPSCGRHVAVDRRQSQAAVGNLTCQVTSCGDEGWRRWCWPAPSSGRAEPKQAPSRSTLRCRCTQTS